MSCSVSKSLPEWLWSHSGSAKALELFFEKWFEKGSHWLWHPVCDPSTILELPKWWKFLSSSEPSSNSPNASSFLIGVLSWPRFYFFFFFWLFKLVSFRHELKRWLIKYVFCKLRYLDWRFRQHLMFLNLTSRWLLYLTFEFRVALQIILHRSIAVTILIRLNTTDRTGYFVIWAMHFFLNDWIFAEEWYLRLLTLLFLNGIWRVWSFFIFFY